MAFSITQFSGRNVFLFFAHHYTLENRNFIHQRDGESCGNVWKENTNSQPELFALKWWRKKEKTKRFVDNFLFFSQTFYDPVSFRFVPNFYFWRFNFFGSFDQHRISRYFSTICCVFSLIFFCRAFRVKFIYLAHSLWRFQYSQIITIKIGNRRKKHAHTQRASELEWDGAKTRDRVTEIGIGTRIHAHMQIVTSYSEMCVCVCATEQRK